MPAAIRSRLRARTRVSCEREPVSSRALTQIWTFKNRDRRPGPEEHLESAKTSRFSVSACQLQPKSPGIPGLFPETADFRK
jgi:hypothetical protein